MANEPTITVIGRVGNDPELKTTPTGLNVATFSVANTPRKKKDGEWTDGETMWFRVVLWNKDAENAMGTIRKGNKVIVTGSLIISTYKDKEGKERPSYEINADGVGVIPTSAKPVDNFMDKFNDKEDVPW